MEDEIVSRAYMLLEEFSEKTSSIRKSIKTNRKIWELKDPEQDGSSEGEKVVQLPTLVSNIEASVADQMDNMPDVQLLPETPGGRANSDTMADVIQYILDRRGYKSIHRQLMVDMFVAKACVVQTFWDPELNDGEGDVSLIRWPIENFYWDPAFDDIQDGRACFKVAWFPKSWFEEHYPDKARFIEYGKDSEYVTPNCADDGFEDCSMLMEYWYRKFDSKTNKYSVHVAKIAGGALLECSEKDDPEGIYAHGMYPFDLHSYRKTFGSPVGMSMVDDFIEIQRRANRLSHYIDENARRTARFKMFVSKAAEIDNESLTDWNKEFVPIMGNPDSATKQIVPYQLNPQVDNHMQWLLDVLKRESGQNNSARGEFGGGVTAASAIQSLQEAGTKVSRMHTVSYQQCFKNIATKILWLAAQYYDKERVIVISGKDDNKDDQEIKVSRDKIYGKRIPSDSPLPSPPFTVQVVIQRSNPQRIDIENQWVLQIAQMFAQNGVQVPVSSVISMLTMPGRDRLLRAAQEIDARNDAVMQLQDTMQQQQQQMEQLKSENDSLVAELTDAANMIKGTDTNQMQDVAMPAVPSMPKDPNAYI